MQTVKQKVGKGKIFIHWYLKLWQKLQSKWIRKIIIITVTLLSKHWAPQTQRWQVVGEPANRYDPMSPKLFSPILVIAFSTQGFLPCYSFYLLSWTIGPVIGFTKILSSSIQKTWSKEAATYKSTCNRKDCRSEKYLKPIVTKGKKFPQHYQHLYCQLIFSLPSSYLQLPFPGWYLVRIDCNLSLLRSCSFAWLGIWGWWRNGGGSIPALKYSGATAWNCLPWRSFWCFCSQIVLHESQAVGNVFLWQKSSSDQYHSSNAIPFLFFPSQISFIHLETC